MQVQHFDLICTKVNRIRYLEELNRKLSEEPLRVTVDYGFQYIGGIIIPLLPEQNENQQLAQYAQQLVDQIKTENLLEIKRLEAELLPL